MTLFSYKARNKEGSVYESDMEAKDKMEVYHKIKETGDTVITVIEQKNNKLIPKNLFSFFSKIKTRDKIIFARNLGSMIEAGLPVTRALSVMQKQSKNKSLKKLLQDLENDINKGKTLSDSMKERSEIFSPLFISMVKAGEESGNLSGSLSIVSKQMEKSYALVKKIHGALIYPSVIISVMIVLGILMLIYMVPTLTATFEGFGLELPLSTRIIIFSSNFLINHTFLVISVLLLIIFSFIFAFRTKKGKQMIDFVSLKIPVIGEIVKEVNSARTARTLSSLLSSGVDFVVAIGVTIDVMQNVYYKKVLEKAKAGIQKGENISSVFMENEKLYPAFVGEMVSVGEETGKISEMLLSVAVYYEEDVDQSTKDLSTIIEPVLMIIIGAGVGIFAISMLSPTYSLVNVI